MHQIMISSLADSVIKMQMNLAEMMKSVNLDDKNYVTKWKECCNNIGFSPNVQFLRKLKRAFDEVGVPDEARVKLACSCLSGTALQTGRR